MRHETMNAKVLSPTLNPYIKIKSYPPANAANQWGGDQKEGALSSVLVTYFC